MVQIPTMFWIVVLAPVLIASTTALWLGLRGRRMGSHPVCRACGFDLRAQPAASPRCPECGALLDSPNAVVIGDRHRRPFLATVGATIVLLSSAFVGLNIYGQLANIDSNKYMPVWWLTREADSSVIATRDAALKELLSRAGSGALSKNQMNALSDHALVLQADQNKLWVPAWGDLVEQAHTTGMLSDEKWQQYARQAVVVHMVVRPVVRRGDQIPVSVNNEMPRGGTTQSFWLSESFTLDSKEWARDGFDFGISTSGMGGSGMGTAVQIDRAKEAQLANGEHRLKITVHARLSSLPYPGGQRITDAAIPLEATFKLVPATDKTVSPVNDTTLQGAVEQSITARDFRWNSNMTRAYVEGMLDVKSAPADLAFKVFMRADGKDQSLGEITIAKGTAMNYGVGGDVKGITSSDVDLVLKPDLETARQTVNLTTFWNGTVTIHHVHINGTPPPSSRPTTR